MAQTQGGSPDGQLVFDHYIIALNNASGGLGGFAGSAHSASESIITTPRKEFRLFLPAIRQFARERRQLACRTRRANAVAAAVSGSRVYQLSRHVSFHDYRQSLFHRRRRKRQHAPVVLAGSSLPLTSTKPPAGPSAMADNAIAFLLTILRLII